MAGQADPTDLRTQNLLRDAEEALQQERMLEFWRQWGNTIIGMAIMLVVGTGAGVAWREWQESRNEKSTAALSAVLGSTTPSAEPTKDLRPEHAAIVWLSMAANAATEAGKSDADRKQVMTDLYGKAAATDDDSVWAWFGRWNLLRMKMDEQSIDAEALLKDYEKLAQDMEKSSLSALAWIDAALIAGERMKDPARALSYIDRAEKIVPRGTTVSAITSDLKHLYEIRRQAVASQGAQEEEKK